MRLRKQLSNQEYPKQLWRCVIWLGRAEPANGQGTALVDQGDDLVDDGVIVAFAFGLHLCPGGACQVGQTFSDV